MHGDQSVMEILLERAKATKLPAVTVIFGRVGFGHTKLIHTTPFLDHYYLLVIEIVDEDPRLRAFAATIDRVKGIGLVIISGFDVLLGGRNQPSARHSAQT